MNVINILDKKTIEKIAAGEVVERPSSVIKELVENALDAHSTNITVEIKNGGLTFMRISDNGVGMSEADAKLCFVQHATSKISKEQDLFNITTLGFRGEALSSIAAVSRVELFTKTEQADFAINIKNNGGEIESIKNTGRPNGTTIIVKDLFYNIPARLAFVKSATSEASAISNIVSRYIIARPDVSFKFINNDKEVYHSMGDNTLKNAIFAIYGSEVASSLIPIEHNYKEIKISGYLGMANISRGTKNNQSIFVNGRYIKSDSISAAVRQGYANNIMLGKFPMFVLNLTVDFDKIDVNVHPNKLDVKFSNESIILEEIYKGVKDTLYNFFNKPAKPTVKTIIAESTFANSINTQKIQEEINAKTKEALIASSAFEKEESALHQSALSYDFSNDVIDDKKTDSVDTKIETVIVKAKEKSSANDQNEVQEKFFDVSKNLTNYKLLGQLFNTYLLLECEDNFVLIDQHAAHERLNTDKMLAELESQKVMTQKLLMPYILECTNQEYIHIEDNIQSFVDIGFEIQQFGNNTFKISAVPHILGQPQLKEFFLDVLDSLSTLKNPKTDIKKDKIFQTACKHSVKAGDQLSHEEIDYLLQQTIVNQSPLNCPHGRPILVVMTKKEIEKQFGRIV